MAEELEKKPKVELIKHTRETEKPAAEPSAKPPETGERRKVVVVKKKTPPAGAAPGGNAAQKSRIVTVQAQDASGRRQSESGAGHAKTPPEAVLLAETVPSPSVLPAAGQAEQGDGR